MMQTLIPIHSRAKCVSIAAMILLACAISALAAAQSSQSQPGVGAEVQGSYNARPGHITLLREGSSLVQTAGVMRRNNADQWVFVVETPSARAGTIEMILLPCATLEEMERVAATATNGDPRFETTGEAFVYMNKNYFLPTHSPYLLGMESAQTESETESAASTEQDDVEDETEADASPVAEGDSVDDIMKQLEERAGPIARSTAPTDAQQQSNSTNNNMAVSNGRTLAREDMMMVDRRGHLTRSSGGAWVFVFDADAEGLADPPAFVMPCLLLERMQQEARQMGNVAPMLLTGRLFTYHGRSYILPTLYRVPHNRTQLVP